jgi:hypothetical protein
VHEALIDRIYRDRWVHHVSRDATAIEGHEKPRPVEKAIVVPAADKPKRKRGRPRKGEERVEEPKELTRIEKQKDMSLPAMLADLPQHCDVGTKRNAKGYKETWIGYKLHIDTIDGDIPVSCILTAASVHDSQVAIPLATMTAERLISFYDLMDTAYDAAAIRQHSRSLGHVPIIPINPRRDAELKVELAQEAKRQALVGHRRIEDVHYDARSSAERVNAYLKDNHGGRTVQVRGGGKVMCHLMFGILVIAALQIVRIVA